MFEMYIFCLQWRVYLQIQGAGMGSPVSPTICTLYIEHLEFEVIRTAPHQPVWWHRYVDVTRAKLKKKNTHNTFTDHLNTLDLDIKFTTEGEEEKALAFLDTLTVMEDDGS
ncbi:hypothetical protein HOLleu_06427 [Holothuria leucospilota]|uniref:Uncharacterized protein n=1 Tax=Holothuria leucospilota TaxID=206669 RepID=A0A9Q1CKW5_HOLLE|nr:hypothetical protein HOLleu_06427 [Holothuria leucospilota]